MAAAAAGQSEAMKAVYMVAQALDLTDIVRSEPEIDDAIRYVVDGAAEFMWRV